MHSPVDLLRLNLSRVRIPESTNRIFKQECCISFDSPRSDGGLFIDMNSFLAFGERYVEWNYRKTGNCVYLNIKQTKKSEPDDRPLKKPTLLAIGIDGGFNNHEPEYEESLSIVIWPDHVSLPLPSTELPEKVRLAVDTILMAEGAERKQQVASWMADKKQVSAYAVDLKQISRGTVIPSTGWTCAKCDKTDNLWLNLTDGMILCGRRNWDGSGGNNHAVEHYRMTNYPLAVKLGTITTNLDEADVFSYPEDESVLDPLLPEHLSFFGIDFPSLRKTELTTAERELDQNINFDWNRIQESDSEIVPLSGPGYTGLINLGNSCYLASIMQVIFSTRPFCLRYYEKMSLEAAYMIAPADPTVDLATQLTKLGHGLLSGKYSHSEMKQEGISPHMFKTVIAFNHPEFSSAAQQDALEFLLHLLDQVEQTHHRQPEQEDPTMCFKFILEERLLCSSGKVAYNRRMDCILSLNIPLHAATNREQLEAFNKLKLEGKELGKDEIVRPRVTLDACFECFSASEELHDFYSTALNSKTTAIKTTRLVTFPTYLVLHMRKFVMEAGWVPKKLDVYIDVPDIVDISNLRSKGIQPGEELLPEAVTGGQKKTNDVTANADIVAQLASMGFNYLHCQKAAISTSNVGVEEAMNWLLSHIDDPESRNGVLDDQSVGTLMSFGFSEEVARKALKASDGNIERATDWIFSSSALDTTSSSRSGENAVSHGLPDGGGRYKLMAIVSHIGTSTHCGHYVAHVHKNGQWVIFNDSKVGVSKDPPKDMGYLYFFERLTD